MPRINARTTLKFMGPLIYRPGESPVSPRLSRTDQDREATITETKEHDMTERCPRCDSPAPHLHPAMQAEGEVELCTHDFHMAITNQNRAEDLTEVRAARHAEAERLLSA